MTRRQIIEWMNHPELLDEETLIQLEFLVQRFPLFTLVRFLYLKNLKTLNCERFNEELTRSSVYITNLEALYHYIEQGRLSGSIATELEMHEEPLPDPVEVYLQTLEKKENPLPANMLAKQALATQDYATYFLSDLPEIGTAEKVEEKKSEDRPQRENLLDQYLEQAKSDRMFKPLSLKEGDEEAASTHELSPSKIESADSFFTESLAKIYVQQKKYDKALNIIKRLSLKYPEKNSYFADQIRYLEIVINNINI